MGWNPVAVYSLIEINNKILGSNNLIFRKVNVQPYGYDEMCMDKDVMEDKLYQIIDHLNEMKFTSVKFSLKINTSILWMNLLDTVY